MGVTGGGISINGPSGIDTASLVDQLTALEQQKVTTITDKVTTYKTQISAYGKLQSTISTLQTAAKDLNTSASFDLFKSNSTDSDVVTLTGGVGAIEGNYDIQVAQLAGSEKMISKDKFITSQTATLSSLGVTVGDISIDGTKITIDANDTIQDVRMKINNATDSSGQKLNVSASVIQASTNNFRLVLTAKTTGSQGVAYRDETGATLQGLGIIGGVSGVATQVVTTQNPIQAAFDALKAGAVIQYTGVNHGGTAVNGTFTKTSATTSVSSFLTQLNSDFGVTASVNGSGNLVLTDSTSGASQLGLTTLTMNDAAAMPLLSNTFSTTSSGAGSATQAVTSQNPISALFDNLKAGATIQYSGTGHGGAAVNATYTKPTATTNISTFLSQIQADFGATATVDGGGNLVITDSISGVSSLAVSGFTVTDAAAAAPVSDAFDITATGDPITAQQITTQTSINALFADLKTGATISYSGTDHNGAAVSGTYTKTAFNDNISDFVAQIQSDFGAAGSIDGSGNLVLTDSQLGISSLAMSSFTITDSAALPQQTNTFSVTTTGASSSAKAITSQNTVQSDFDNLKAGATITYSGVDHTGATVNNTYTKAGATTNISAFLAQIQSDFGAVATIDGSGNLVLTDSTTGASSLSINTFDMTDTAAGAPASFNATTTSAGDSGTFAKGSVTQSLTSSDVFGAAATGDSIGFTGKDHSGNTVTSSFTKTAGSTAADFIQSVQQAFLGTVDVAINGGNLVITDKTAGTSQLSVAITLTPSGGGAAQSVTVNQTTTGKAGVGVMAVGRDSYFTLDGMAMSSSDNNVENVIGGTTINLHKASSGETVQTTLTRDTDAIKAKIQKLVDAYNSLQTFVGDETKMADPNDSSSTAGDLAGDTTVKNILNQVRNQLMQPSAFTGDSYNSLTMIGVKTDASTGQMSIDDTQFTKAITNGFDDIEHLFITTGVSSNSNIAFGRKTKDTVPGTYTLRETDAGGAYDPNFLSAQLSGNPANPWYTSDIRSGDIVTFSSGPLNGLSLTSPAATIGSGATETFTFSLGMGDGISDLITSMTDSTSGIITEHNNSLNDQIKESNSRAADMQTRVNDYHDRLVKQFSAMEQAMNTMKTQMSNMLSALGSTTTSS